MYKAIIHDWDDTIIASYNSYSNFYIDGAKEFGFPEPDVEQIRNAWGKPIRVIMSIAWNISLDDADQLYDKYIEFVNTNIDRYPIKVFPGVNSALSKIKESGVILGIVTSGDSEEHMRMKHPKETKYHDFIYGPDVNKYYKPDPRVFDQTFSFLKKYKIDEKSSLYIGDGLHDYAAARDRGMDFIAVTTGTMDKVDFLNAGLDKNKIFNSFSEVIPKIL